MRSTLGLILLAISTLAAAKAKSVTFTVQGPDGTNSTFSAPVDVDYRTDITPTEASRVSIASFDTKKDFVCGVFTAKPGQQEVVLQSLCLTCQVLYSNPRVVDGFQCFSIIGKFDEH